MSGDRFSGPLFLSRLSAGSFPTTVVRSSGGRRFGLLITTRPETGCGVLPFLAPAGGGLA